MADNITIFEIMTLRKSFGKSAPFIPDNMMLVKMRNRPFYKKKEDAQLEINKILKNNPQKTQEDFRLTEVTMPKYMLQRDIKKGRILI